MKCVCMRQQGSLSRPLCLARKLTSFLSLSHTEEIILGKSDTGKMEKNSLGLWVLPTSPAVLGILCSGEVLPNFNGYVVIIQYKLRFSMSVIEPKILHFFFWGVGECKQEANQDSAFLTSSQETLMLLIYGPHFPGARSSRL